MTLSLRPIADPAAPLARRNPVAKVGAALLFAVPPVVTVDPFTPAVTLAVEMLALPFFGVRPGVLARRMTPPLVTVLLVAVLAITALPPTGFGMPVLTAAGLVLRVLAVALPVIVVFATTDPTDLADALVQNVGAPARLAIGTLTVFRLVPLLAQQWRALTLARRARGVDAGRPWHLVVAPFTLPARACRRGRRLATAVRARGLGSGVPRTYARRQHFTFPDLALLGAAALTVAVILAAAVALG